MSTLEKLKGKIFSGSSVSYKEAENILFHLGYELKIRGSHHGFRKAGYGTVVLKKRPQLLEYQIRELRQVLVEHGYENK